MEEPRQELEETGKQRALLVLRETAQDAGVALLWVVLVIAILIFAGGGSNFIYVDF